MTDKKIDYGKLSNPLLHTLPEWLKDPKNYIPVQKALLETMACKKSHGDPSEMFTCTTCTENMVKRRKLMEKFGFGKADDELTSKRYMEWKRTHEEIKKRMPLDKYNHMAGIK